jgi:hypothetical protein
VHLDTIQVLQGNGDASAARRNDRTIITVLEIYTFFVCIEVQVLYWTLPSTVRSTSTRSMHVGAIDAWLTIAGGPSCELAECIYVTIISVTLTTRRMEANPYSTRIRVLQYYYCS